MKAKEEKVVFFLIILLLFIFCVYIELNRDFIQNAEFVKPERLLRRLQHK